MNQKLLALGFTLLIIGLGLEIFKYERKTVSRDVDQGESGVRDK